MLQITVRDGDIQTDTAEELIKGTVDSTLALEEQLRKTEAHLMQFEEFRKFITLQKQVKDQADKVWKSVEEQMIAHNIRQIKGDWGTLTIAERLDWNIDVDKLPARFFKKTPNTTLLSSVYRLEGKTPEGAEPVTKKYLVKRLV